MWVKSFLSFAPPSFYVSEERHLNKDIIKHQSPSAALNPFPNFRCLKQTLHIMKGNPFMHVDFLSGTSGSNQIEDLYDNGTCSEIFLNFKGLDY